MRSFLSFVVSLLIAFNLSANVHAQGIDPFGGGGDPFGSNADPNAKSDPFGGGGGDPFGSNADPNAKSDPFGGGDSDPFGGGEDPFGGDTESDNPFAPGDPPGVKTFPKRAGEGSAKKDVRLTASAVKVSDTPVEVEKAKEKIVRALMLPGDFVFVENSLEDVIAAIEEAYDIQIEIDTRALDGVGIGTDTPISLNLRKVSLKHAIRSMLRELELTTMIADEVLMITTPEEAESNLITRIYPVSDLVEQNGFATDLGTNRSLDELMNVIVSVIQPSTWDDVGGPGNIKSIVTPSYCLVCSNTETVHELIAELLSDIRKLPKDSELKDGESKQKEDEAVLRVYLLKKDPLEMEQIAAALRKLVGEEGDHFVESAANHIVVKNTAAAQKKAKSFLEAFIEPESGGRFGVR